MESSAIITTLIAVITTLAGVIVYLYKQLQKRNDQMIELALEGNKSETLEKIYKLLEIDKNQKRYKKTRKRSS